MKKTAIALTLTSLLTLPLVVSSDAWAAPVRSLQKEQNYEQFISKRQVVDQLLADAARIFHSPARVSDAGFTAKMPSNMEQVTTLLLEAHQLEPYRTDLLISAANAQIYNGNLSRAITLLEQAQAVAPDDLDINSYLAIWQLVKGNKEASRSYLAKVADRNSGRAADLEEIIARVQRITAAPLQTELTEDQVKASREGKRAIVTLGYALNPDGSMISSRFAVTRVVMMGPAKPFLMSIGMRPEWSIWAWVTSTASMLPGWNGRAALSISSRPCCKPQSTRIFFPLTSRQWQLPVTHWSAP